MVADSKFVAPQESPGDMSGQLQVPLGLNDAIIEDYYPGWLVLISFRQLYIGRQDSESPEFEAKYYPQYDYDEDDGGSQLEMSGFIAMDEEDNTHFQPADSSEQLEDGSIQSGLYGTQYSDSDIELPDDFDEEQRKTAPSMWDSWGVLRNIGSVPLKPEDIELNSLHREDQDHSTPLKDISPLSQHPRESFDLVDEEKYHPQEGNSLEESQHTHEVDGSGAQKILQVVQGPYDEDMQRAWALQLEDLSSSGVETLAGWYAEAPKVPFFFFAFCSTQIGIYIAYPCTYKGGYGYDRRLIIIFTCGVTVVDDHSYPRVRVKVSFSLRLRLFSGEEWPSITQPTPTLPLTKSSEEPQRSSLFKDSSSHRIHKNLLKSSKAPKAIQNDPSTRHSGRNSANSTEISLTNITLHFRTYDSELRRRNTMPQSSIPALKEQVLVPLILHTSVMADFR